MECVNRMLYGFKILFEYSEIMFMKLIYIEGVVLFYS